MKAHSEKVTEVSEVKASDEVDRPAEQSRSNTTKANSKIVKGRI